MIDPEASSIWHLLVVTQISETCHRHIAPQNGNGFNGPSRKHRLKIAATFSEVCHQKSCPKLTSVATHCSFLPETSSKALSVMIAKSNGVSPLNIAPEAGVPLTRLEFRLPLVTRIGRCDRSGEQLDSGQSYRSFLIRRSTEIIVVGCGSKKTVIHETCPTSSRSTDDTQKTID